MEIGNCRGHRRAKNHPKNSKKARSAFLFFLFFLVQVWII